MVIELVLHEAGKFPKLGMYLPSKPTSCMVRRIGATFAALVENLQKRFAHVLVDEERPIHQASSLRMSWRVSGCSFSLAAGRAEKPASAAVWLSERHGWWQGESGRL